ncbi:uncharacterized protein LOC100378939 [Saccoglossus kowalevskii]|uniref:Uncharacterized protein LOC100378939 n=1 Tax=Saccoglossus kowalevskii TaxID=10224 RepID=A0ABM0H1D7_SACKO|nr:PREDICTED: uncharacterized protein LOC100378939 [Saccoglossus kowalevskii]
MAKSKTKKSKNGKVVKNGSTNKEQPGNREDFCCQITRTEILSEMEEIDDLKMVGRVMEHNGTFIRRPRPERKDAMTMTSCDVGTQIKKDMLVEIRRELDQHGQSTEGPTVVAFKPGRRRPPIKRPKRSIKTQTSRDFSCQATAEGIRTSFHEDMIEEEEAPSRWEEKQVDTTLSTFHQTSEEAETVTVVTTTTTTTTTVQQEDGIREEWKLEIVDDDGLQATPVSNEDMLLLEHSNVGVTIVTTEVDEGVDNPSFEQVETNDLGVVVDADTESDEDDTYL